MPSSVDDNDALRSGGASADADEERTEPQHTLGPPPRVGRREPYDTGETLTDDDSRRRGLLEAPPTLSGEQQRRQRRRRTVLAALAVAVAIAALVAVTGAAAWARSIEARLRFPVQQGAAVETALTSIPADEVTRTVLIVGTPGAPTEVSEPPSLFALLRVTPRGVSAIALPPETAVYLKGQGSVRLAETASMGGYPATIEAIERSIGTPVNDVLAIRLATLARLIDAAGGVWLTVPAPIDDPQVWITKDSARIDAGYQQLDGSRAMMLLLSRSSPEAEAERQRRQGLFIQAFATSLSRARGRTFIPIIGSRLAGGTATDMSAPELLDLLDRLRSAAGTGIQWAGLPGSWRGQKFVPDESALSKLRAAFRDGASLAAALPKKPSAVRPASVTVTVRNGSGIAGMAAQAAAILKAKGYRVREVGNADRFVYTETLVVYKSRAGSAAQAIAKALPVGRLVESRGMYAFDTAVLVVVGKDWESSVMVNEPVPVKP